MPQPSPAKDLRTLLIPQQEITIHTHLDPVKVVHRIRRIADLPGGGSRMIRDPLGVHGVWVNGAHVFDGKEYVPVTRTSGRLLRDAGQ